MMTSSSNSTAVKFVEGGEGGGGGSAIRLLHSCCKYHIFVPNAAFCFNPSRTVCLPFKTSLWVLLLIGTNRPRWRSGSVIG